MKREKQNILIPKRIGKGTQDVKAEKVEKKLNRESGFFLKENEPSLEASQSRVWVGNYIKKTANGREKDIWCKKKNLKERSLMWKK